MTSTQNKVIAEAYKSYGLMQLPSEVNAFAKFFTDLHTKNVMEIGSCFGGMFYIMSKLSREDGIKISVDYPFYDNQSNDERYKRFTNDVHTFSKNTHMVVGDSHNHETLKRVEEILGTEELDFLFIDGDHSYEGVKQDFEMYKHLVKDGGYIAFHDINDTQWHRDLSCYVAYFWNELKNQYETTEFNAKSFAMGIGIVQVFKHKRKLNIDVSYEAPGKIHIVSNEYSPAEYIVSIRDKETDIPIYYCDLSFGPNNNMWWIVPLPNLDWRDVPHFSSFIIEFYDKNRNFIDSKELKVKESTKKAVKGTRVYSPFDCLWINHKQMFIDGIYDRHDLDNLNVVIDLGANVGMFSNYIAGRGAQKVHAIEPTQKAFEELQKQFYYYNWIMRHKIGIATENGRQTIYSNNDNSTISSFLNKTSDNSSEEVVDMFTLPTFYRNNNITKVDLVKIDIEGMEYGIIASMTDEEIYMSDRYLIEYHMNEDKKSTTLLNRFRKLGYEIELFPDNPEDTQGYFYASLKKKETIIHDTNKVFPKRAFVTFTNEYYLPITEKLVRSLQQNSKYPIIVYSINCDVPYKYPNMITKRIDSAMTVTPKFSAFDKVISHRQGETVEVLSPIDSMGIVDRNDIGTYITLSRKPLIMVDAINNGLEEGIFLDADGIAKENIDSAFEYLSDSDNYPLVGRGLFEYMMLNGLGDPAVGPTLEQPLMDLLGVSNRTMSYVSTNFILFSHKMKSFMEEWAEVADNPIILNNNIKYAPYHDETLVNVLLWKYNVSKSLPRVHYNLTNAQKAEEFYTTDKRGVHTDSDWHYIPQNIDDIKYFHGCKSLTELDKVLSYMESRKSTTRFNYHYKKFKFSDEPKIAIVTLFDQNYSDLAKISIPNKIEYAAKHGYDFIYFDETIDATRPPQWSKVMAVDYLLDLIPETYEWVWWIDIDTVIMNFDTRLEDIIDPNYDIIFTKNKYSIISNGSSFYKRSQLTKRFLRECYTLGRDILQGIDIQVFDHEQQPMRKLYLEVPEYQNRIKLIHERVCNSYWYTENESVLYNYPNWNSEDNIYQSGDFVANFCGRTRDERIDVMTQFINKSLP